MILVFIALALSPILIQLSFMKVKHNEFTISKIGTLTAKNYYLARVYGEVNNISMSEAREHIKSFEQKKMIEYLTSYYKESIYVYVFAIATNLFSGSNFINTPDPHPFLDKYMKINNIIYFCLHVVMIPFLVIVLFPGIKKKKYPDMEIILGLLTPISSLFLIAGISFWQGDRLIVPALPTWILLYSFILSKLYHPNAAPSCDR